MILFADGAVLQLDPLALGAGLSVAGSAIAASIAAAVRMLVNYQREKDAQLMLLLDKILNLPVGTMAKAARDVRRKLRSPADSNDG